MGFILFLILLTLLFGSGVTLYFLGVVAALFCFLWLALALAD